MPISERIIVINTDTGEEVFKGLSDFWYSYTGKANIPRYKIYRLIGHTEHLEFISDESGEGIGD